MLEEAAGMSDGHLERITTAKHRSELTDESVHQVHSAPFRWASEKTMYGDENLQDASIRSHQTGKHGISRPNCLGTKQGRLTPIFCRLSQTKCREDPRLVSILQNGPRYRFTGWGSHLLVARCQFGILKSQNRCTWSQKPPSQFTVPSTYLYGCCLISKLSRRFSLGDGSHIIFRKMTFCVCMIGQHPCLLWERPRTLNPPWTGADATLKRQSNAQVEKLFFSRIQSAIWTTSYDLEGWKLQEQRGRQIKNCKTGQHRQKCNPPWASVPSFVGFCLTSCELRHGYTRNCGRTNQTSSPN